MQTYADSSGAILLDPTESLESSATVVYVFGRQVHCLDSSPCNLCHAQKDKQPAMIAD